MLVNDLIVGCPVNNRAWIMPYWFKHVTAALAKAEIRDPKFLFVASEDDDSLAWLNDENHPYDIEIVIVNEPAVPQRTQTEILPWCMDRYYHMVGLRNELLERVRHYVPFYFWSLDSDILVDENVLLEVEPHVSTYDAIGMHCYMTPPLRPAANAATPFTAGREFANKGDIVNNIIVNRTHYETQQGATFPVGCLMAAKFMTPNAYFVDYAVHPEGEDVGWSLACKEAGLKLGWCSTALAKHVMYPSQLHQIDPRVGF